MNCYAHGAGDVIVPWSAGKAKVPTPLFFLMSSLKTINHRFKLFSLFFNLLKKRCIRVKGIYINQSFPMPDFIIICQATIESVSYRKQHEYSVDELRVPAFIDLTKTHCAKFLAHY